MTRTAKGPYAERISREEEKEKCEIIKEEYRSVKLSKGKLEYIDNDPVSIINPHLNSFI